MDRPGVMVAFAVLTACGRIGFSSLGDGGPGPDDDAMPTVEVASVSHFGGALGDGGNSVAVDAAGNVIVMGVFNGTIDIYGTQLVSAGARDMFVAAFTSDGALRWARRFGGTGDDYALALVLDGAGNSYLCGQFAGSVTFEATLTSAGAGDGFVASFDPAGAPRWSRRFGGAMADACVALVMAPSGDLYLAGFFQVTASLDGLNATSAGSNDLFLARYTTAGVRRFVQTYGAAAAESAFDLAVAPTTDEIYVAGAMIGTPGSLGGGTFPSLGNWDAFLAAYDGTGAHRWSRTLGGTDFEEAYAIATGPSGDLYLTGWFQGTASFGGPALTATPGGFEDVFVARYDAAGNHQWSRRFGGPGSEYGQSIVVDAREHVFVAGYFDDALDFDDGPHQTRGDFDAFVASFTRESTTRWSRSYGGPGLDNAIRLAAGARLHLTGTFSGDVDFGGTAVRSAGQGDVYLLGIADY